MFAVQDDWIQYEAVPARRAVVRGGAVCAQRLPVVRADAPASRSAAGARPVRLLRPAVQAPSRPAAGRSRLRLTRRGRVVLVVLPGLLALSGTLVAVTGPGTAAAAPAAPAARTVVVGSGDSLWSIAERLAPSADPRAVVAALQRANGITGGDVAAGEVLRLPVLP